MATFSFVTLWTPSLTLLKWPVPSVSPMSYSSVMAVGIEESIVLSAMARAAERTRRRAPGGAPGRAHQEMNAAQRAATLLSSRREPRPLPLTYFIGTSCEEHEEPRAKVCLRACPAQSNAEPPYCKGHYDFASSRLYAKREVHLARTSNIDTRVGETIDWAVRRARPPAHALKRAPNSSLCSHSPTTPISALGAGETTVQNQFITTFFHPKAVGSEAYLSAARAWLRKGGKSSLCRGAR